MALEQKLQLKLSQKLILTPALQQAIKLLPMATLELVDVLNQEVVENPLLEEMSPEELQQTDEAAQVDKADPDPQPTRDTQDTWDDADGTPGKTRTCDPRLSHNGTTGSNLQRVGYVASWSTAQRRATCERSRS